jgi:glycosyltransferase involved in cell wall biosynthesis
VGGISEFISDSQTGYLTEIDPRKMANRILEIASDKKSLYQIGLNANKLLSEKFSVTKMAENYKDLYMQLMIRK